VFYPEHLIKKVCFGGITGDSSPGRDSSSVIPSLSLQLILRRKKTYTINGEILGRVLGRTM
jgi:hypothetical protein